MYFQLERSIYDLYNQKFWSKFGPLRGSFWPFWGSKNQIFWLFKSFVGRSKWEPIFFFGSLVLLNFLKVISNFFNQNIFIIFRHHSKVFLHQIIFFSYVTDQFEELNDLSVENKKFSPKEIGVELYFTEVRLRFLFIILITDVYQTFYSEESVRILKKTTSKKWRTTLVSLGENFLYTK